MKRFLSAFILFAACSLMSQPQAILRNAMTTNIAGTPVLSRSDLSVTNVGSGTNWLFYGTAPNTVARLVDIALGAGTLWATVVSNVDGSVTISTNATVSGTNIYGLSVTNYVLSTSNALQTSMSNTVGYVSNILNTGIVTSSNKSHLDLTNLVVAVSNSIHVDMTNLNVVTSNALQISMSNTVDYVSNVLAQGAIAGSNQIHLDLTNLTVLVSNATHLDMTNLVNASSNNFSIKTNMIAGVPTTTYVPYVQANGVVVWTNLTSGSGSPFATVVSNANGTITVYTNSSVTGTNIYGLAVADPLNLTTMNVQDLSFTNVTGTFTNANNFGTNKPGSAGNSLLSDGGYIYWGTPAGGGDVTTAQLNAASNSLHLDMTNLNVVTSNALQQSMSNTVDYASNILMSFDLYSSNKAHIDLTNLTVLVSNATHLDITNLNVVTSNALQQSMSNTVDYVSNVLAQGAIAGSNQIHLDLTNLTVLVSNATHLDMTNLVNASSNNFSIKTNMIAGAPTTNYVPVVSALGTIIWTNMTPRTVGITLDGGGSAIAGGITRYISVPYSGFIKASTIMAQPSGSIECRIWRTNSADASFPPTAAGAIGTNSLTADNYVLNTTLANWTTLINARDVLGFNIPAAATTITNCTITLEIQP